MPAMPQSNTVKTPAGESDPDQIDSANITSAQVRRLRALAHHLRPVVLLGAKGLTTEVTRETDAALEHHELIKVRSSADGKQPRREELQQLANATNAQLVQLIGRIGVLYRAANPPVIFALKPSPEKS